MHEARSIVVLRHPLKHYLRWSWLKAFLHDRAALVVAEIKMWLCAPLMYLPGRVGSRLRVALLGFRRVGRKVRIWEMAWIKCPENISIGDDVRIHPMTYLHGAGGIEIGSHVGIGAGVKMYSLNHRYRDADRLYSEQGYDFGEIVIEDDVWIGSGSVILAGVRIRTGTVVAAGAVVTKDTESYSVVGGVPARVISRRVGQKGRVADPGA